MADNYFARFDDDEAGSIAVPAPAKANIFSQFDSEPDAAPAREAVSFEPRTAEAVPGISLMDGDDVLKEAFGRLEAANARSGTEALHEARGNGFIDGLMDAQQYTEAAKGVVPGAIGFVGSSMKGVAGLQTAMQADEGAFARRQIEMFDRIDRGEFVPHIADRGGYRLAAPEQRAAMRADMERLSAGFRKTPVQERVLFGAGQAVSDYAKTVLPPAPGYEEAVGRQLGEGVGSLLAGLPAGFLGRLPAAAFFGAAGSGEALERALSFDRQEKAQGRPGLTQEQISVSSLWGIAPGTTDLLPVETLLGRLKIPAPFTKIAARAIGRIGGQAFIEGMQEGGQQFLQNLIAREIYNPQQQLTEAVLPNSGVGAGVGGIAQTAQEVARLLIRSAAGRRGGGAQPAPAPQPAPTEEPFPGDVLPRESDAAPAKPQQAPAATEAQPARVRSEQEVGELEAFEANFFRAELGDVDLANENTAATDAYDALPRDRQLEVLERNIAGEDPLDVMEEIARRKAPETAQEAAPAAEDKGERGVSLLQFIRSTGGLRPSGELDAVDARRYPGLVNSRGLSADKMREALVEAGYLEESGADQPATTTPQDVFDLVARAIGGERIVPIRDRSGDEAFTAAQVRRDEAREFQASEQTFVLPEIARYDAEFGEPILRRAYDGLDASTKREVIDRNRRGEDVADLIEEMAIRLEDAPTLAAMALKRGLTEAQRKEVRALIAREQPDLLARYDEMVTQVPMRAATLARARQEERAAPVAGESAPAKDEPSPALRQAFADLLDEGAPRSAWAARLGVREPDLEPLIAEAVAKNWLRRDARGRLSRTPKEQRAGGFAAMAVPENLPQTLPGDGDVVLTDEAQARRAEMQAAVDLAASRILPTSVRVDVVDAIEIARLNNEDNLLAIAGVRAISADLEALDRAKEMRRDGSSREDIWQQTGWYEGVDGKWRFEINDNKSVWLGMHGKTEEFARQYLMHDALYNAYPGMGAIRIYARDGTGGVYHPKLDVIGIGRDEPSVKRTTLHELQHAIQKREGFATGANPDNLVDKLRKETVDRLSREIIELMDLHPEAARAYRARNVHQSRMGGLQATGADLDELTRLEEDLLRTEAGRRLDDLDSQRASALHASEDYWRQVALNRYLATAGEVEARNVERRMNMTPEERRATPPWITQDTAESAQIIEPGQTESANSAIDRSSQEGAADEPSPDTRATAGRESGAPVAGESAPGGTSRPGEGRSDSGAEGRNARILRAESGTFRADGSIIAGRPSREGGQSASGLGDGGSLQAAGTSESFGIPGYAGYVTAEPVADHADLRSRRAPDSEYKLASLVYRVYPEGTGLPSPIRDVRAQIGDPLAWARIAQHTDGTWEVAMVRVADGQERKGIASKLYAAVESDLGIRMSPSGLLSKEGLAFWQKRSPASVQWHQWFSFERHYISPRRIRDRLDAIGQEIAAIARRPVASPHDELDLRSARQERGALIKLWGRLPAEARAKTVTDSMFALRGFYSPAIRAAEGISMKKGAGEQFLKQITKAPGVRRDELEWMGLEEFLADRKSITKDEVLAFMRAHQIELDERVLGGPRYSQQTIDQAIAYLANSRGETPADVIENWGYTNAEEYVHVARNAGFDAERIEGRSPTRYATHKIPGGENYRELLIRLPSLRYSYTPDMNARIDAIDVEIAKLESSGRPESEIDAPRRALYAEQNALLNQGQIPQYLSKHFDDQEVVHLRVDDRTGPNGGKVLFINEVQSDNHQQGQLVGYTRASYEAALAGAQAKVAELESAKAALSPDDLERWYDSTEPERLEKALQRLEKIEGYDGPAVEMPFKGDAWLELALKRAVLYAVENGYDSISWARSDQIAKAVGAEPEKLALQYDQKIGRFLNKYTKKWGGDVSSAKGIVAHGDPVLPEDLQAIVDEHGGSLNEAIRELREFAADGDITEIGSQALPRLEQIRAMPREPETNPILSITPAMRASVMEGQPLALRGMPQSPQILTPEFRRWFGESKVVDENGRPLVVYHGTARAGFGEFDTYGSRYGLFGQGGYFTESPAVASEYTDKGIVKMRRAGQEAQAVYPVYLSIKNPIDMDAPANAEAWSSAYGDYIAAEDVTGRTNEEAYRVVEEILASDDVPSYEGAEIMQDGLRAMGHDGITHLGGGRVDPSSVRHRVWVAFDPNQIKSATGNRGTFDPTDPRINNAMSRQPELQALGQTDPYTQTISIAMHAIEAEAAAKGVSPEREAVRVLRHEAVEFFRAVGMFTPKEWSLLQETARKQGWIETTGVREAYSALYREGMSDADLQDLLLKEAVAEQYSAFHLDRKQFKGAVRAIFERIRAFLIRAMNALRGMGFQTWEDVFQRIDEGEFARRFDVFEGRAGAESTQEPDSTGSEVKAIQATAGRLPDSPARQARAGLDEPSAKLADLVRAINDALSITARQGRIDPGLKARASRQGLDVRGQTSTVTGVVRLRITNEIDTLAHEGGHVLENRFRGALEAVKIQHAGELTPLASPGPDALSEGFAEWFRRYVTNPAASRRVAPRFEADFEQFLNSRDPAMLARLREVRQGYQEWLRAPSGGAVASTLATTVKPTARQQIVSAIQDSGFSNTIQGWVDKLYASVFDDLHPVHMAVQGLLEIAQANLPTGRAIGLKTANNAYKLLRLARDAYAAGHMDLLYGVAPYRSTQPAGPSLREAMATAFGGTKAGQWNEGIAKHFNAYLVSRRMVQEWARFAAGEIDVPPHSLSLADHQQSVKDYEAAYPRFKLAAQQVYAFLDNMLRKKRDAGLITPELYAELAGRDDYVPVLRDMSDRTGDVDGAGAARKDRQSVIKRFRGSQRDVIAPLESIAKDAYETAMIIARNDAIKALDALARAAGPEGGKFAERIPAHEMKGSRVNIQEAIRSAADAAGVSPADLQVMIQAVDDKLGDNAIAQVWRAGEINEKGEPIVYLWEGGERIPIRLADGQFGHDMLHAITGLNAEASGWMVNLLSLPSTAVRFGVTASLDFIGANHIRDQVSAWVLTRDFVPFWDGARGIYSDLAMRDISRIYSRAGGIFGGANVTALHESRVKREVLDLRRRGIRFTVNPMTRDFWRMTEFSETGTRIAVFEKAFARARKDGLNDWEAALEAAFAARDLIDFGRRGSRMLAARRLVPFLNASLQGLDRTLRGLRGKVDEDRILRTAISPFIKSRTGQPLSVVERRNLGRAAKVWGHMVALGMVGLALGVLYRDDEEYQELSDYMRATHWLFRVDGQWVRIPKPFELAFFSNMLERTFEYAYRDDEKAFERFKDGLFQILVPPHAIPGLDTAIELATNQRDVSVVGALLPGVPASEREGEIVGPDLKRLPPELQFNAYTSEFGKYLGEAVGISPAYIDHAVTGFGASMGRELLNVTNAGLPALGRATGGALGLPTEQSANAAPEDYFFVRRFLANTTRGSVSSRQFWALVGEGNGRFAEAAAGYRHLVDKARDALGAQQYLDRLPEEERAYALLEAGNSDGRAKLRLLHPLNRAREIVTVAGALRREITMNRLYDGKGENATPVVISPSAMRTVDDVLAQISMREARNALIALGTPGWRGKAVMAVAPLYEELAAAAPDVHEIMLERLKSKRLPSFEDARERWPEARKRLLEEGQQALLRDLYAREEPTWGREQPAFEMRP